MSTGALQDTLAAEHAAVWVYALLGGRASESETVFEELQEAYRVHRERRDQLLAEIAARGAQPVAAEVGYDVPVASTLPRIIDLARRTEMRCAATYADLVARTEGRHRAWGIEALTDAAVRQLRFRGSPEIFPGAQDLADR